MEAIKCRKQDQNKASRKKEENERIQRPSDQHTSKNDLYTFATSTVDIQYNKYFSTSQKGTTCLTLQYIQHIWIAAEQLKRNVQINNLIFITFYKRSFMVFEFILI